MKECPYDPGGYFVVKGVEKVRWVGGFPQRAYSCRFFASLWSKHFLPLLEGLSSTSTA